MFKNATAMDGRSSDLKSWKAVMLIAVLFISLISVVAVADSTSAANESIDVDASATLLLNDDSKKSKEITVTVSADNYNGLSIRATGDTGKVTLTNPSAISSSDHKSKFTITGTAITASPVTVKVELVKSDAEQPLATKNISVTVKNVVKGIDVMDGNTTISKTTVNLYTGADKTVTAKITPTDATVTGYTWSSDKPAIATVSTGGKITAVSAGTARITVTSNDQDADPSVKSNYIDVKVIKKVDSFTVSPTTGTVKISKEITLVATISPADATINTFTVTTDKPSMLEYVTQTPSSTKPNEVSIILKAIGETAGVVDVTIATNDSGSSAPAVHAKITTETIPVTGVKLDHSYLKVEMDDKEMLKAIIEPSDATIKTVSWVSSNPAVAMVDDKGNITPKSFGTTTITAKTTDGGYMASCQVEVTSDITIPVDAIIDTGGNAYISDSQVTTITESIKAVVAKNQKPLVGIDANLSSKLTVPSSLIKTLQDTKGGQLAIGMLKGELYFSEDAIDELDVDGKSVGFTFSEVESSKYPKFEKAYIYDISVLKDDKAVETAFGSNPAKIAIYHFLQDGEKIDALVAAYVYGDGDGVKINDFYFNEDAYFPGVVIDAPHMSTFLFMFHDSEYISTAGINTTIAIVFLVIIVILAVGIAFFTFNENASEKLQNLFKRNNTKRPPMSPPGQDPYGYYQNNQFNGYGNNYNNYNNNNGNNNYR